MADAGVPVDAVTGPRPAAARIVGVLCTFNEAHRIRDSLGSLVTWCDEVVVVDQHSTDATREIAADMGARVELHPNAGLPEPARDWARDHVEADWVVFLDADEMVPATLAAYLRRVLTVDSRFDVLLVPRLNIELGRWLRSADSWPSRKARIARPQALDITTRIHRGMRPRPGARVGRIAADPALAIWHFHHADLATMVANVNRYTTIELDQTAPRRIRRPSAFELVARPGRWLWRNHVRQRGFRDGRAGLIVAVTRAYYQFLLVAKRWDRAVAADRADGLAAARARLLDGHRHAAEAEARAARLPDPVPVGDRRGSGRVTRGHPNPRRPGLRRPPSPPSPGEPAAGVRPPWVPETAAPAPGQGLFDRLPDPPACPPGWRIGPPDFVILGAQKAGTTWWFRMIEAHPRVVQPAEQRPELHFFDRRWDTWPSAEELAAYQRYFPRPDGSLAGEKTPDYIDSPWVLPMLADAAPDVRVILLFRDPIERYLSGRAHAERAWDGSAIPTARRTLADRRRVVAEAIDKGRYASQLEAARAAFTPGRVLALQYERCVMEPRVQIARTHAFLGLEPHELTDAEIARPRNRSRGERPAIDPQHVDFLRALYRPEVERLGTLMPDLDLSLWPSFADLG